MRHGARGWVCSLTGCSLLLVCGCADIDPGKGEAPGELGGGVFRYECVDAEDASCDESGTATAFPTYFATEGEFDVAYDPFDPTSAGPGIVVAPASEKYVITTSDHFRAKLDGEVALLARRTSDSRLMDFVHIEIQNVAKLRVQTLAGDPVKLTLNESEQLYVRVTPVGPNDDVLAGSRAYDWTSSDGSVVALGVASPTRDMTLQAVAPGTAEIQISSGSASTSLTFTVQGAGQ